MKPQLRAVKIAPSEEVESAQPLAVVFTVGAEETRPQEGAQQRKLVTAVSGEFVFKSVFGLGLINSGKPVVKTKRIGMNQPDAGRPLPVPGAGIVHLQKPMPGIGLIDIVMDGQRVRLGPLADDRRNIAVGIQIQDIEEVAEFFLIEDAAAFGGRPFLHQVHPQIGTRGRLQVWRKGPAAYLLYLGLEDANRQNALMDGTIGSKGVGGHIDIDARIVMFLIKMKQVLGKPLNRSGGESSRCAGLSG